ncbi:MAG: SRPBCC family protein [Aridibacter famidurans]|nr:SRPBCC family protein [Aridibacter famidurans]
MKYRCEIEIERPVDEVVRLFDDPDNMKKWMPGLESFEPVSGEPGLVGATSRLKFDMNGRKIEMIETITSRNLPDEFSGTYETEGVFNLVRNRFEEIDGGTNWVADNEFRFTSLAMKLMAFFMPGAFKKETMKHLKAFKDFAESQSAGEEEEE